MRKTHVRLLAVVSAAGLLALAGEAQASHAPACPTVTADLVLTGDCHGPLVVAASGTETDVLTVDLNGFTVSCGDDPGPGVSIEDQSYVQVVNGTVTGCEVGIELRNGDNNRLIDLVIPNPGFTGILLDDGSDGNRINGVSVSNAQGAIDLGDADGNRINNVEITGSITGISLAPDASANRIVGLMASDNSVAVGISGDGNTVTASETSGNFTGIVIGDGAENNVVRSNVTSSNLNRGILVEGDFNLIQSNTADANDDEGIYVLEGGTNNTIKSNRASGNGGSDLRDDNANCDANVWKSNLFGTRSQDCIH